MKIYDKVSEQYGVPVVLGYSLGSNVATHIGVRRKPKELILVAAFESVHALSVARLRPIPRFFIQHRFETINEIDKVQTPFYLFVTVDDGFVPISQPRKLKEKAKNMVKYKEYDGYNHAQLLFSEEVCEEIATILDI